MQIRAATEQDLTAVHRLDQEWVAAGISFGIVARTPEQLRAALGGFFLVAEEDGAIVGYIAASRHASPGMSVIPAGAEYLEIDDLYVVPVQRSRGCGSALLEQVLAAAGERAALRDPFLGDEEDIHRVMAFYEAAGFQGWGVQMFREL